MTSILKLFSIETIITFLTGVLLAFIKNPDSARAKRLAFAMRELRAVVDSYFKLFPDPTPKP